MYENRLKNTYIRDKNLGLFMKLKTYLTKFVFNLRYKLNYFRLIYSNLLN